MRRWRGGDRREQDLNAEIQGHLDLEAAEHRDRGLSAAQARESAIRAFGDVGAVREDVRHAWGWTLLEQCAQDVRYAFRTLGASPGFALTAVISLALGIGMNTGIFSLADALVFRPLAIRNPAAVVVLRSTSPETPFSGVSYPDFKDFRDKSRSFEGLIAHRLWILPVSMAGDAVPQMRMGMKVSRDFFQLLGVEPILGRGFLPEETEVPGRTAVAVLSHGFWRSGFNSDPQIIGRTIQISRQVVTIVGVAPERFTGMDPIIQPFLYIPATFGEKTRQESSGTPSVLERRNELGFVVRGRLREGVSLTEAQAELSALATALEGQYPETNRRRGVAVRSETALRGEHAPGLLPSVVLLLSLAGLVLAIVCANVANLFLSRARGRAPEIAIRLCIGAGQFRLARQLLTESAVIAVVGGLAGLAVAFGVIRYLRSIRIPTDTPMVIATELDVRVLVFSAVAVCLSALAFGLVPAWQAVRADLVSALKRGDVTLSGRRRMFGRQTLVVGQIAICLVLLVAAGLMFDAFRRMLVMDTGFRTDRILMMDLDPGAVGYSEPQARDFYRQLVDGARSLPGVRSAALSRAIPFRPSFSDTLIVPEGYQLPDGQRGVRVSINTVDDGYFETMGTAVVAGRGFTSEDRPESRPTAIVNDTFAKIYWPGADPLGRRFRLGASGPWIEVVGVARTAKYFNIAEAPQPYIYLPLEQHRSSRLTLLVYTAADPLASAAPLRQIVRSLDPGIPIANTRSLQAVYENGALGIQRLILQLISSMGMLGLCLALVGLYAVVTYSVRRRMREFGVRMSIGATRADILRLVMREGFVLAGIGILVGLVLSVPVQRALGAALAGLGPLSAWTLVVAPLGLLLVTMAACLGPAWRAAHVDAVEVMRVE